MLCVLLGLGSFAPIHRMHVKAFDIAKEYLEANSPYIVVGGYLSPAHDIYVKAKLRSAHISGQHRMKMGDFACSSSKYWAMSGWECRQRYHMDFEGVLDHHARILGEQFKDYKIKIMFLCGADLYVRFGLSSGIRGYSLKSDKRNHYPVVVVGRTGFKWHKPKDKKVADPETNMVWYVPIDLDDHSSTKIRNLIDELDADKGDDDDNSDEEKKTKSDIESSPSPTIDNDNDNDSKAKKKELILQKLKLITFDNVAEYLLTTPSLSEEVDWYQYLLASKNM